MSLVSRAKGMFNKPKQGNIFGDFETWAQAAAASNPYTTDLDVYGAKARAARDSGDSTGLTTSLILSSIALARQPCEVLDFGGGLGFAFFVAARELGERIQRWNVVELPDLARYGRENFRTDKLRFIDDYQGTKPDVVILAGVLQYLADPYSLVRNLVTLEPKIIALDRTPIGEKEVFRVQRLGISLGGGSHPYRILVREKIETELLGYRRIADERLAHHTHNNKAERYVAQIYRKID